MCALYSVTEHREEKFCKGPGCALGEVGCDMVRATVQLCHSMVNVGVGYEEKQKMVGEEMVVGALHPITVSTDSRHQPIFFP